jgi:hypothetical protein
MKGLANIARHVIDTHLNSHIFFEKVSRSVRCLVCVTVGSRTEVLGR